MRCEISAQALQALVGRTVVAVATDGDTEPGDPQSIVLALDDGSAVLLESWGAWAEDWGVSAELYPNPVTDFIAREAACAALRHELESNDNRQPEEGA